MALTILANEHLLIPLVAQGDEKAFAALFYGYQPQLSDFVFSITKSVALTEEIVQDVFLKIWQDKEKLTDVEKFTAYLFIITRNHTLNAIRKANNKQQSLVVFDDQMIADYNATEASLEVNYQELLDYAVAELPPRQQTVFLLKGQGLKNAEIASQMAISPHSVKKYQQWSIQAIEKFIRTKLALKSLILLACSFYC